jgi:general secretion pathway protein D
LKASKPLPALLVFALGVASADAVIAASHPGVHLVALAEALGQTSKSKATTDRQEVESLMVRARAAIKERNFDAADSLISSAEKRKVEFSFFHLGDTPKKLRADLNAAKNSHKKSSVERPSQKFTPNVSGEKPADSAAPANSFPKPQADTRVGASGQTPDPADEPPLELPESDGRLQQSTPTQRFPASPDKESESTTQLAPTAPEQPVAADENPELRRQSDSQLLAARKALAVGDVRRATSALEAARKLGISYGFHDDTPDKAEAAIRKYRQVTESTAKRHDEASRHQLADVLMDQAQQLLRWKDYDEAERLVLHVKGLRVNYGTFEAKPEALLEKITEARRLAGRGEAVSDDKAPAPPGQEGVVTAGGAPSNNNTSPAKRALFDRDRDPTRNLALGAEESPAKIKVTVPAEAVEGLSEPRRIPDEASSAMEYFRQGEQALKDRDMQAAMKYFQQAYGIRDQLDPASAQRLQDRLQMLSATQGSSRGAKPGTLLNNTTSAQQLLATQLSADVAKKEIAAGKVRDKDPKKAMELLKEARGMIEAAGVEPEARGLLLRRVDRKVAELDKYIAENRAQIELDATNREVLKEVDRRQLAKVEVDEKLARLVDEFQKLMDEQRFAEADVLAKRARELDPDNPVVQQLIWNSKFISRTQRNQSIIDRKEQGVVGALESVEESLIPLDDREPFQMPDAKKWSDLTKTRSKQLAEQRSRRTQRELEIERSLKTPVSCKFRNRPLSEVVEQLGKLAAVNMHLDSKGLDEEGVSSDTPITIDLTLDISLKSALHLILEPLHLSYVIKDEVLKITSEQLRDGEVYVHTYNVADLVIPIPNFVPNGRMGLAGALGEAYNMAGGGVGGMGGANMAYLASQDGTPATGMVNPAVMAQINQLMPGGAGSRGASGSGGPTNLGPGGLGGGAQADFDSLIELITTTVKPQTWDEVGGPGSIQEFQNNLSLVISQTQDVHEEIVDLLEQLRRNQDLQVTIEVRFITLNDNFFERIGVDFQFNITNEVPNNPRSLTPINKKEIVGLEPPAGGIASFPNYTTDLNFGIPFRQSSFNLATPQFGQPVEVARFGFAILSDLEAFLLVNAAQGDRRSNVLQAPKVTLFNGQQASVFDQTTTPFVISVIPVVGDFAAAYQPVITVLSEGTSLTVQATISNDRRFVRLTVLPFFSQIGDVREFTFSGSKTTTKKSSASDTKTGSGDSTASTDDSTTSTDGITIQLPNFSFVTVNTTVSVPDGGTVLLGGIKRLSEGRNEFGVPILSKLPYINRLFKNVGIGRETQSLMMMVTPRIIIQEEEEERLGLPPPP